MYEIRDLIEDNRDWISLYCLTIATIALLLLSINQVLTGSSDPKPPIDNDHVISVARGQEVVLEHSNIDDSTGNIIYVYCDLPSLDRIYVVNHDHVTVELGGCKGLP